MTDKKIMLNRIIDFYVGRNDLKEIEIKTILDLKNDLEAINYSRCCKSDSELLRSTCNWCNGNNRSKSDGVSNITDIG